MENSAEVGTTTAKSATISPEGPAYKGLHYGELENIINVNKIEKLYILSIHLTSESIQTIYTYLYLTSPLISGNNPVRDCTNQTGPAGIT